MSCVGAHYGYLPEIFSYIIVRKHNIEVVKDLYFRSKHILKNKACYNRRENFIRSSAEFLTFCKNHDSTVNFMEECAFLRELLESKEPSKNFYYSLAQICFLEENYEDALRNIQIYQEQITLNIGNVDLVTNCYSLKMACYITLGNKSMAKKILKKFKRFKNVADVNRQIDYFQNEIEKMSNANSTAH